MESELDMVILENNLNADREEAKMMRTLTLLTPLEATGYLFHHPKALLRCRTSAFGSPWFYLKTNGTDFLTKPVAPISDEDNIWCNTAITSLVAGFYEIIEEG